MAAAMSPVPRMAVPVLVTSPPLDGIESMISEARSDGGGLDELAIERLRTGGW